MGMALSGDGAVEVDSDSVMVVPVLVFGDGAISIVSVMVTLLLSGDGAVSFSFSFDSVMVVFVPEDDTISKELVIGALVSDLSLVLDFGSISLDLVMVTTSSTD